MLMFKNLYKTFTDWVEKVMHECNRKLDEAGDDGLGEILDESVKDKEVNNPKRFL